MGSHKEPQQQDSDKTAGSAEGAHNRTPGPEAASDTAPAWADGLKELYRSVVDEPLPGNFQDLLDKFDETGEDGAQSDPENPA